MFKICSPRIMPLIITSLLFACGGGLLYPLWSKDYSAHQNGNKVIASNDKQSIYVASGLREGLPLQILKYDLAGNLIASHEYREFSESSAIVPLKGDQFYLQPLAGSIRTMQHFDLNRNSYRPAFKNYPFEGYAKDSLKIFKVGEQDNLIINGRIQQQSGGEITSIIGILTTDGNFSYQALSPNLISERIYQNANNTNYVIHAATTLDYMNSAGIQTVVIFLDEHLNIENTVEFAEEFISSFAFNQALYGRFRAGPMADILISIQKDGTFLPAPIELTAMDTVFGADHFYQLGYKEDNIRGKREICRFSYEPKRLNCFFLSIEGDYHTDAQVLEDGAFAITEQNEGYVYQSAGINFENIDAAVMGGFTIKGYYQRQYRQRSVSPEGKLILDSKPAPFKEVGHFEVCYDEWLHYPHACLVTEYYEAGTCSLLSYEFPDSNHLLTLTQQCESQSARSGRLNYWEADSLGSD